MSALMREAGRPVPALAHSVRRVNADVSGPQLFDAAKQRARREHRPEREGLGEARRIEIPWNFRARGEDALHLAREVHAATMLADVQWTHPEPITGEQ